MQRTSQNGCVVHCVCASGSAIQCSHCARASYKRWPPNTVSTHLICIMEMGTLSHHVAERSENRDLARIRKSLRIIWAGLRFRDKMKTHHHRQTDQDVPKTWYGGSETAAMVPHLRPARSRETRTPVPAYCIPSLYFYSSTQPYSSPACCVPLLTVPSDESRRCNIRSTRSSPSSGLRSYGVLGPRRPWSLRWALESMG
jgi:hypothetical protein